jgi:hypothetical protein
VAAFAALFFMTHPEVFFGFKPLIVNVHEATEHCYLDDQALYVDRLRRGYDGSFVGGLQAVVTSKPGQPGQALTGEEVQGEALRLLLNEGFDLLLLSGSVDSECGAITVDDATLVISDAGRYHVTQMMMENEKQLPVIYDRIHALARAAI